jgi:transposase InsO family protein
LWKLEGLRVPQKQRKRRRLGTSAGGCVRRRAEYVHHVWSYDFVWDQTEDGGMLKLMPIVDEFSRECLTIEVARSITAAGVVATLERLFEKHGAPDFIRSDNGPEFIADAVRKFLRERGTETLFIEPGSPWENPYIESFNSRFRDELLDRELFLGLMEARVLVEEFRREYNEERPHSSLNYQTPQEFAAACTRKSAKTQITLSPEVTEETEAQNRPVTNAMKPGIPRSTPELAAARLS